VRKVIVGMLLLIIWLGVIVIVQSVKIDARDAQIVDLINNCTELNQAYENAVNADDNAALISLFRELLRGMNDKDGSFALIESFRELLREYDGYEYE